MLPKSKRLMGILAFSLVLKVGIGWFCWSSIVGLGIRNSFTVGVFNYTIKADWISFNDTIISSLEEIFFRKFNWYSVVVIQCFIFNVLFSLSCCAFTVFHKFHDAVSVLIANVESSHFTWILRAKIWVSIFRI